MKEGVGEAEIKFTMKGLDNLKIEWKFTFDSRLTLCTLFVVVQMKKKKFRKMKNKRK